MNFRSPLIQVVTTMMEIAEDKSKKQANNQKECITTALEGLYEDLKDLNEAIKVLHEELDEELKGLDKQLEAFGKQKSYMKN